MGYTHYWRPDRPFTPEAWAKLCTATRTVIRLATMKIAGGSGTGTPAVTDDQITLNGRDPDDFETFGITPDHTGFDFCKTGQRPYDTVVTAVLVLAEHFHEGHMHVSSDGDADDWAEGLALARRVVPMVKLPPGVIEEP